MASNYAWIIDKDHLFEPGDDPSWNDKGTVGPADANLSDEAERIAQKWDELGTNYEHQASFRMYDDDRVLYYSGALYWNGDMREEYAYAPLGDFGMGNAGAVFIEYIDHPEWDCG
ncbi:hypothetical protein SEA_BACHOME_88 [Mycobacterium phage Bachome]|nr:hypothetical protein SEA_BACHOME_88 [Mycobacterium phage Bachome]